MKQRLCLFLAIPALFALLCAAGCGKGPTDAAGAALPRAAAEPPPVSAANVLAAGQFSADGDIANAPAPSPSPADVVFVTEPPSAASGALPEGTAGALPGLTPPPPAPTPFTLLWMTDTQGMAGRRGEYAAFGKWISDAALERNIQYLLCTGDIVDSFPSDFQWAEAESCFSQFRDRLPMLAIAGNHDMNRKRLSYEPFREGFYGPGGADALTDSFNRGQGRFALASFGGTDFLFLGMSFRYHEAELDWMDGVLSRYPARTAVLLFHDLLDGKGALLAPMGELAYERLVRGHENVRLVLCGHNDGAVFRTDAFDDDGDGQDDRTVLLMMVNRQDERKYRGTLQLLTFDPAADTLSVHAYSPLSGLSDPDCEQSFPFPLS